MKKLVFVFLLILSIRANSQTYQQVNLFGQEVNRVRVKTNLGIPNDTFPVPILQQGYPHLAFKGDILYRWSPSLLKYVSYTSGTPIDTTQYMRYADSTAMLTNYRHWLEGYLKSADILGKQNFSDTSTIDATRWWVQQQGYLTSAPTPTWQQALTAGSTLTGNNTITGGGFNWTWNNAGNHTINLDASKYFLINGGNSYIDFTVGNSASVVSDQFLQGTGSQYFVQHQLSSFSTGSRLFGYAGSSIGNRSYGYDINQDSVELFATYPNFYRSSFIMKDTMTLRPHLGNLRIDSLRTVVATTGKKLVLHDTITGMTERIDPSLVGVSQQTISDSLNNYWRLTGNSGVTKDISFIGTTKAVPFDIRANNRSVIRIDTTGHVYINNDKNRTDFSRYYPLPDGNQYGLILNRASIYIDSGQYYQKMRWHTGASPQLLVQDSTVGWPGYGYKVAAGFLRPVMDRNYSYNVVLGKAQSANNAAQMVYYHHSDGNDSNYLSFNNYSASIIDLSFKRRVGIGGVPYPDSTLQVAGSVYATGGVRFPNLPAGKQAKQVFIDGNGTMYQGDSTGTGGTGGYTNLTQFVDQTPWRLFYSNGSGDVTELALGSSGQYLKSNGASSAPTWDNPAGAGTVTDFIFTDGNGLDGTVTTSTTTPTLSIATTVTGMIKGSAGAFTAASEGTDYIGPTRLSDSLNTYFRLGGNTTGATTYFGLTNANDLRVKTNNVTKMVVMASANKVIIGDSSEAINGGSVLDIIQRGGPAIVKIKASTTGFTGELILEGGSNPGVLRFRNGPYGEPDWSLQTNPWTGSGNYDFTASANGTNMPVTTWRYGTGITEWNKGMIINSEGGNTITRIAGDTDPNLGYFDAVNDRVGIGMNNPAYKFDVTGTGRFAASGQGVEALFLTAPGKSVRFIPNSSGGSYHHSSTTGDFSIIGESALPINIASHNAAALRVGADVKIYGGYVSTPSVVVSTTGAEFNVAQKFNGATSGTITIQPQAVAGTYTLTLPANDGDANQVLQTDGSGNLSWATAGGGTPGGSTKQFQYNNAGAFAGSALMTEETGQILITGTGATTAFVVDAHEDANPGPIASFKYITSDRVNLTTDGGIQLFGTTSGNVKIKSPAAPTSWTMTVPTNAPESNGYVLTGNTDGTTSWAAASGGMADPGGNGVVVRTALNTTTNRTLTGTANRIDVTNGDGTGGNPTFDIGTDVVTLTGTQTLENKRVRRRTGTVASSATPTINTDNTDYYTITAQTVDITSMTTNLSGTPTEGQTLIICITGTASRAITWGSSFEASSIALPTTTSGTSMLCNSFIWNNATNKWRIMGTW